jgi:hypothetical protein
VRCDATGTRPGHVCEDGCPGWDFFETGDDKLEVERCDVCDRFDDDLAAVKNLAWLIVTGLAGENHTHTVLLLSSGGTARQWEELVQ